MVGRRGNNKNKLLMAFLQQQNTTSKKVAHFCPNKNNKDPIYSKIVHLSDNVSCKL